MAAGLSVGEALSILRQQAPMNGNAFSVLGTISRLASSADSEDESRDLLIRLLERRAELSESEQSLLDTLTARLGLFPYTVQEDLPTAAQIALEFHRPESLETEGFVFHSIQREIYERLIGGESLLLSAPTSFGKSVITDALVASEQWSQIAIIVPTLALIDEIRRRLARFSGRYKINTFPNQSIEAKTLYVMTQERFLEIEPTPPIDFFMIDEFYKLDVQADGERASLLNIAWDRLRRTGAQYYLTGPNISGLADALPADLREALLVSDFRTVAVDQVLVPPNPEESERVLQACRDAAGQTLIYCRSPARVRTIARYLLDGNVSGDSIEGTAAASWVAQNYDPEWILARCLARGIGLHHARIPRALQHHIVRLFNSGALKYLICTSTLIEGVNTAAENVMIVDQLPYNRRLDYFTFSNIRGRAGRMFRHFVGKVYLFAPSPAPTQTTIDIPIESQSRRASTAQLLQLPEDELTVEARSRIQPLLDQNALSVDILRSNRGIEPERQLAVADEIRGNPGFWHPLLDWNGYPRFEQAVAVSRLMLDHLVPSGQRGPVTERSLPTRINAVRNSNGSVPALVSGQLSYSNSRDEAVEDVLFFNRNWMGHTFPQSLMAIDSIQREVFQELGRTAGNYRFYASEVEALFLPPFTSTLEEYGLPIPVTLKLRQLGLRGQTLDEVLATLRVVAANPRVVELLDVFEQEMLTEVVTGLGPSERGVVASGNQPGTAGADGPVGRG